MIQQIALTSAQHDPACQVSDLRVLRPSDRITRIGDDQPTSRSYSETNFREPSYTSHMLRDG
jgi:hypothetical protein